MIYFHLLSLAFVFFTVVRADYFGMSWIQGKKEVLDSRILTTLHRSTWIGLSLMILTGIMLFLPMKDYLLTRPQFYIKMAFVITLICNGFVIGHLQKIATTHSFASLTFSQKVPLFISGVVSTISWAGAVITALFLLPY